MTGKERILTALELGQPDWVPTYVHAMNEASIVKIGRHFTDDLPKAGSANQIEPEELIKLATLLMVIHEELDIDAITAVALEEEKDIDDLHFYDPWGVTRARNPHGMAVPVGYPIKTEADLDAYERPHPHPILAPLCAQLMKSRFGDSKALFFMVHGVFSRAWYLYGLEKTLMAFIRDPDLVDRLTRLTTDYCKEMIQVAVDAGADAIIIEDDMADKHNPFFSPRHYGRFIAPRHREIVEHAHGLGAKIVMHSDGNLWPLLDQYIEVGFDGLNPLEPEAGMELGPVKEKYGDKICLLGNIDCGELLCHGSIEQVEAAVAAAIDAAAPNGGYILCDSNSIHPGVKPENFIAMMKCAKRLGEYK